MNKFERIKELEKELETLKARLGVNSQSYLELLQEIGRLRGGQNITSVVDQSGTAHAFETVRENPTLKKDKIKLPELKKFEPAGGQPTPTNSKIEKQVHDVHMDMVRKELNLAGTRVVESNVTMRARSPVPQKPKIEPVLVHAQNVHDYFEKHYLEHKWNEYSTFTCAKPPFSAMMIVYDHTLAGKTRRVSIAVEERSKEYFEWYLTPESVSEGHSKKLALQEMDEMRRVADAAHPATYVEMRFAIADGREVERFPGRFFVMLGPMGEVLVEDNYGYAIVLSPREGETVMEIGLKREDVEYFMATHGAMALATIQFMNCRNVEIIDNPPTRQQLRNAERHRLKPPVAYKTLVIHPVGKRRAKRPEGQARASTGETSLHICRGHFKDYREGAGLGRWHRKGMWWWGPQVRGREEAGRVVKDYDVEAKEPRASR